MSRWIVCLFIVTFAIAFQCGQGIRKYALDGPSPVVFQAESEPAFSEEVSERWIAWMGDRRVPVFLFYRSPSSGKWQLVCHIVKRVHSTQVLVWRRESRSLNNGLLWILDEMDRQAGPIQ